MNDDLQDIGIIGGGFSAYCLAKRYPNAEIITCNNFTATPALYLRNNLHINKLFGQRASSLGTTEYHLPDGTLHDRLSLGGNSEIWGGFCDLSSQSSASIIQTHLPEIKLWQLTPNDSIFSRGGNLHVLLDKNNNTFSAADYFKTTSYINSFVLSVASLATHVQVTLLNAAGKMTHRCFKKIYLACGVTQTIDLLLRSGFLKSEDRISLSESGYELRPYSEDKQTPSAYEIDFRFFAAAAKFIGYKKDTIKKLLNLGPFCVTQSFLGDMHTLDLAVAGNRLTPDNQPKAFGKSIHYGSMKINGMPLASFLNNMSDKIEAIGPVSIPEIKPGPVSNQIIEQVFSL